MSNQQDSTRYVKEISKLLSEVEKAGNYFIGKSEVYICNQFMWTRHLGITYSSISKQHMGTFTFSIPDKQPRVNWYFQSDLLIWFRWGKYLEHVERLVAEGLSIGKQHFELHLHKLLLYEQGGSPKFFDTKEDNMFATLIIQLPSYHEGGEIVIKYASN